MSIVLDLIFEMYGYKACMYSFVINKNSLKIKELDYHPRERQINVLDNNLLNFDNLVINKV